MRKIDYSRIQPGMIVGTTDTLDPLSAIIRAKVAGVQNTFNPKITSHVLLTVKEHDLIYGVEMYATGIRQVDLNIYEHGDLGNHITFVADPFARRREQYNFIDSVNAWILRIHTLNIKYDFLEVLRFICNELPDDGSRFVCSDLAFEMLNHFGCVFPEKWKLDNTNHSPFDQQNFFTNTVQLIKWWR